MWWRNTAYNLKRCYSQKRALRTCISYYYYYYYYHHHHHRHYYYITDHFSGRVEQSGRCVCVCLCIHMITFERNDLWPRYLAWRFSLVLSRSGPKFKVIGHSSGSQIEKFMEEKLSVLRRPMVAYLKHELEYEYRWCRVLCADVVGASGATSSEVF